MVINNSFLLFTLTEAQRAYWEENNYICYDKSHKHLTCVLAGVTDIDMAIHWYTYMHVCMYMHVYLLEMSLCLKP